MEKMNTPNNVISINKENLIPSKQYDKQAININNITIEKIDQLSEKSNILIIKCLSQFFIFNLIVSIIYLFPAIFAKDMQISEKNVCFYNIIIFSLMVLIFDNDKIVLLKDQTNKKLLINVMNHLYFTKMTYNLELDNTHFYVIKDFSQIGTSQLFIINDYNIVDIDLDESNIKQKPAKFLYYFNFVILGKYKNDQFKKNLNDFVGSSIDYKNLISLYINTDLKNKERNKDHVQVSKYIRFSEHFSSYYIKSFSNLGLFEYFYGILGALFVEVAICFSQMEISSYLEEENRIKITLISMVINIFISIIMYILYKFFKLKRKSIFRIDYIYSKDFDRIFIGLVNYTETKYENTFEYQMNNINRFIFEKKEENDVTNFHLKVIFKNDEIQEICYLRNQREDELEGLINFLNERLIINNDN